MRRGHLDDTAPAKRFDLGLGDAKLTKNLGRVLADRRRLDVIPGLTCIWQVSGRGCIPFAQQVRLDVQYIESQSLYLDFLLLMRTVPAVLLGRGAF